MSWRLAPTTRVVATESGELELVCGSGSRKERCMLTDPSVIEWLFEQRAARHLAELEASCAASLSLSATAARRFVADLIERGALVADDARDGARREWSRMALAIHEPTRDLVFESSAEAPTNQERWVNERAADPDEEPAPPPFRDYEGARIELAAAQDDEGRSCGRLRLTQLGALLELVFAVQEQFDWEPWGLHYRRSAPSLGARHATEAFVLARSVENLADGVYRVDPRGPTLVAHEVLAAFADASAIVLTIRWDRFMWKYRDARYYSMALFDAGHLLSSLVHGARCLGLCAAPDLSIDGSAFARALGLDELAESPFASVEIRSAG